MTWPETRELEEAGGPLADHAARLLSARFALELSEWNGEPDHPAAAKLNALSKHSRELIALRRGDHSAARLRMEQVRFQREQEAQEELGRLEWKQLLAAEFEKWIQKPEILKLIQEGRTGDADIINAIRRRVYGAAAHLLTPQEHRETDLNLAMDGDGI